MLQMKTYLIRAGSKGTSSREFVYPVPNDFLPGSC